MADITVLYKNNTIATMSASGSTTLDTAGFYCEDDITIVYQSPGGGGTTGTVYQDGDGYIVLDPNGGQLTITQDSTTKVLTIS